MTAHLSSIAGLLPLADEAGRSFRPYHAPHFLMLALFAALTGIAIWLRRRSETPAAGRRIDLALAVGGLVVWAVYKIFVLLPGEFAPERSLPLQVCDWSGLIVPLAILTSHRRLRAITYFWGLGLSSQALLQPDLQHGPRSARFWLFWLSHFAIVGGAIYDVMARGFRPRFRDYGTAVIAGFLYIGLVFPADVVWNFNYGYIGERENQPAILYRFGAWPGRVAVMAAIGLVVFALMWLPWELQRRRKQALPFAAPGSG